jgi:quercetin dioxygenase-like cupin family protein
MKVVTMRDVPAALATGAMFTGTPVSRQTIFQPDEGKSFNFAIINFSAGSRNKFHTHTSDQILVVTEGTGTVATDAGEHTVAAGDVVLIPAGEKHWHGAPGSTPMSHITITAKDSKTTQLE